LSRHGIDTSLSFVPGKRYQRAIAVEGSRFLDSATDFSPRALAMIRTFLGSTPPEARTRFFNEVRGVRRRMRTPIEDTTVGQLLSHVTDISLLHRRAVASRIRLLLAGKGLLIGDAFSAFDLDRDGSLSFQELYGGLQWLGLPLSPDEVAVLVQNFDSNGDGTVTLAEFKAALHVPGMEDEIAQQSLLDDVPPRLPQIDDADFISFQRGGRPPQSLQDASYEMEGSGLMPPCNLPLKTAKSMSAFLHHLKTSALKQVRIIMPFLTQMAPQCMCSLGFSF
jgi:hypothetical protein